MQNSQTENNNIYDNVSYNFTSEWPGKNLELILENNLPNFKKYKSTEIKAQGRFPVIDQGLEFISGYIDNEEGLYKGDLPVVIFGDHTRNIKFIDFPFAVGADGTKILKPIAGLDCKFFYYYLKSIRIPSAGYSRHYKYLKEIEVPIPNPDIQMQIVNKIASQLPVVQDIQERISKTNKILQDFRQSVLSAAVTGNLTEGWRLEQKDYTCQDTLDLLLSNKKEWQSNYLKKNKDHIDASDHDIDLIKPYDYPDNWMFSTIGILADLVTDGEHITPNRTNSGYYLLSARNIQNGYIDLTKVDYIPEEEYIRITKRCNPQENDILISCSGSVGRVCRVPKDIKFTMVRSAALVKMQSNQWFSPYLELFLQSPQAQSQIYKLQKATAQANLFIGQIKKIITPLPSIKEQELIVNKVNFLLGLTEEIVNEIDKAETKAEKLTQSILVKAFRGEI